MEDLGNQGNQIHMIDSDISYPMVVLDDGKTLLLKGGMICYRCRASIEGDPKYHQVYENGKLVGVRHRRCVA